jgi:glucuronate isomerase
MLPAFRPDKALAVHQPEGFNAWVKKLAEASDTDIGNFSDFLRIAPASRLSIRKAAGFPITA